MPSARLGRASRSRHRRLLFAICAIGLIRGLFWVATISVFHPIDETQHFAYVESLARGHGIPVVGRDITSDDIAAIAKDSPTLPWRSLPVGAEDPSWRANHEGIQGPVYYAAMAPAYWMGRAAHGELGALYAVRVASLVLALTAIPLTWLLARELFPDNPSIWILAAAVLAVLDGFNSNLAAVTNDAIVLPLGALSAWLVLRAGRGPTLRRAACAGLAVGVAVLAKTTVVTLVPALAAILLLCGWRLRADRRSLVRSAALFAAGAIVPLVPWVLWNLSTYHATSAAKQVNLLLGAQQTVVASGLAGVSEVMGALRRGFWTMGFDGETSYRHWWEFVVVASAAGGLVAAGWRRDRAKLARLAWLAGAIPLGMLAMVAVTFVVFDRKLGTPGRYLYPLLPLVAILVAAGLVTAVGRRWAPVILALAVTVGFAYERGTEAGYLRTVYEQPIFGPTVGVVVEQSRADDQVKASEVRVAVDCPVHMIAFGLSATPATISVSGPGGDATFAHQIAADSGFAYYQFDRPVNGPLSIPIPAGSLVRVAYDERDALGSVTGAAGNPVLRVYCPQDDPFGHRFRQMFPPLHVHAARSLLGIWPDLWLGTGIVWTAGFFAWAIRTKDQRPHRLPRTSASPRGSERYPDSTSVTSLVSKSAPGQRSSPR